MRSIRPAALAAALVLAAACSHRGDEAPDDADGISFARSGGDSAALAALGPGDEVVTSRDGAVRLALIGDTVTMQLSDSLRRSVRADIDSSAGDGLGGMIARSVGSAVEGAMGFAMRVPVQELKNVRYEDGRIRFDLSGNRHVRFSSRNHTGDGENDGGIEVGRADGERFVEAVRRRQQRSAQAF